MTEAKILAEPGMLGRRDVDITGGWSVHSCEFERGKPYTVITAHEMHVPAYDHIASRTVRAHEMLHAKLSPADLGPWLARGNAQARTLMSVEEARINFLVNKLGFPADKYMKDGSESQSGDMVAANDDWTSAVLGAVSLLNSAGLDAFMRSIKKTKPQWDEPLREIFKKIRKDFKDAQKSGLIQHTGCIHSGLSPWGFRVTEAVAAWLERIIELGDPDGMFGKSGELALTIKHSSSYLDNDNYGEQRLPTGSPSWGQVNVGKADMRRQLSGTMSKTRRASDVGRNPRRITRILTDPQKRIFDSKRRAPGGIVLIDASGSMNFSPDNIREIVEACPGCVVAMYSEDSDGSTGRTNLFILAEKGKFVDEIPNHDTGNNIDLPALQWAVKQRRKAADPVVWVTDGGVTATDGDYYPGLLMQCVNFCRSNNILLAENQSEALYVIKQLANGKKPPRTWPPFIKNEYEKLNHVKLSG